MAGTRGFIEDSLNGLPTIQARLSHFNVPLYQRQKVIEVVGNAARQHAERFQLARPQQLFFDLFAPRNLRP